MAQIAAYYFPNYHNEPMNDEVYGKGWTEWELVRNARSRFPGHDQPKIPLWGFEDESDPAVMAKKIAAAADNGIDGFLVDWYWYKEQPYLERAITKGIHHAVNRDRIKYALMWANHDWTNIHPINAQHTYPMVFSGVLNDDQFDVMADYVITTHFKNPSYWLIDGCPWFILYDTPNFIRGFGNIDNARKAMDRFRDKVRAAGFPDLHLSLIMFDIGILPGEEKKIEHAELVKRLGAQSVTSYVWMHHMEMKDFPVTDFEKPYRANVNYWHNARKTLGVPYFPNVTMGWDSAPRSCQEEQYGNYGYPACPMMSSTPALFRAAMERALEFVENNPDNRKIVTINAWNEWTEGSYLEPDATHKYGYLEAICAASGK